MNKQYNLKLDLQFRCNNSIMTFNQFDNNTSDFFMRITNGGKLVDIEKAIVVLAVIKPSGKVSSQFVEVENGLVYADLKPSMKDEIGTYTAKAMLILENERVVTDVISYEVEEDKIFSLLNDTVEATEEFTMLTDMLSRLSTIEISEEQRMINEAERILAEENRKIEEAKRVEAELIRQHEEADRAKYDATRESNENIRKQNESIRLANETNRIDEEAKRVEEENKRKLAEEERNANYNFMTEDEERRRSEANAHKEAEILRVQAETNRVNEEAKRRTTEQARVSAENTRVSNENVREANEVTRQTNETQRVEAETQRQSRYNSFITDAEANANNFENYTNTAKVKEEERKANELDRKSQETQRVSNENERLANEETRKANEVVREENEISRQDIFEDKVDEFNEKITELNTTKDNFVSSINTKVDTKISEIEVAKSDMTTTVSNKVNEVETRFNALTSKQQQDAEVIDARDGETSLKARLDRDIEKANKELDKIKKLEESTVSTVTTESDFTTVEATSNGYFEDVKLEGKTLVNLCKTTNCSNGNYVTDINIPIKGNQDYTICGVIAGDTSKGAICITSSVELQSKPGSGDELYALTVEGGLGSEHGIPVGNSCIKITSKENEKYLHVRTGGYSFPITYSNLVILEGDHTQNPPSYFEGLKSVGQSGTTSEDGADEIVVSSVNENLFDESLLSKYITSTDSNEYTLNYTTMHTDNFIHPVNGDGQYTFSYTCKETVGNKNPRFIFKYDDGSFENINPVTSNSFTRYSGTSNANKKLVGIKITFSNLDGNWIIQKDSIMLNKGTTPKPYTPHQSDKKRLLYYNNETQTWEKPILRQWDSIEKHADGKYYYHQRSAEVVFDGSSDEGWYSDGNTELNCKFRSTLYSDIKGYTISDRFNTTNWNVYNIASGEEFLINGVNGINVTILKSKLSTQDVAGFKAWLQVNPTTVVYQLAQEKVYECTNIDLITYNGETNFILESGAIVPKTTLKVHNNISNIVSLLQKKVSLLESNVKASQEVQDMMILETDMRMLDIELALMEFIPMKLNLLGGSDMLRSTTYFNFLKNHIINETYEKEYLENVMNKYLATGRINQDEYDELYKMLYPPVYDIELPIEY